MDSLKLQQKRRNKDDDNEEKQQEQQPGSPPPPPPPSPPPTSSSPTHEFSFTISLHQPAAQTTSCCLPAAAAEDKTKNPSSIALDLSPADDIFFHGHLLPLHLLSHLPVSPRSSTNSMDSFTLPIKDLLTSDHHHQNPTTTATTAASAAAAVTESISYERKTGDSYNNDEFKEEGGGRAKSKSFSWLSSKWNRSEIKEEKEKERQEKKRKKLNKLDVSELLKRYMRMVRPLLSFRNRERRRSSPSSERQQTYYNSYSGNLSFRRKQEEEEDYYGRSRRRGGGEFSAPASMRTSPTNSGLLVAPSFSTTASHDSTMEELQAAIQAAIAHCKNSIAVEEDKINCHLDS